MRRDISCPGRAIRSLRGLPACEEGDTADRTVTDGGNGPMARKLKTYQTSLGFFDLAIAAPSMKAALEAWGAGSNLFHQGVARETDDPDVVAATMSKPGVILKRPAGSSGRFAEHSELPTSDEAEGDRVKRQPKAKKRS